MTPPTVSRPENSESRYERLEELGRGGMAVVYKARDRQLNRLVALKILQEGALLESNAVERFRREAETAARLSHRNLVPVFDVGEENGRPFLVMELVEGESLEEILRKRKTKIRALLQLLEKVARGVGFAHRAGIVHRDLKPANILVSAAGEPKVTDFGLAHLIRNDSKLTRSGTAVGTPTYMAPEQARGHAHDISPATDVYALGAILYEILTGAPPHYGQTPLEVYDKIVHNDPIRPSILNSRLHPDLETICLKALEKKATHRYANADDLADDVRRFLDDESIVATPPAFGTRIVRRIQRNKAFSVAVGLLAVFVFGTAAFVAVRSARRTWDRNRLMRQAAENEARGEWGAAAMLLADAQKLAPDDAKVYRRRRVAEEMDRAVRAWAAREAARRQVREIVVPTVPPSAPASAKETLWQAEAQIEETRREIFSREQEAEQAALAALSLDPAVGEARRIEAELCLARREEAFAASDHALADWWAARAVSYGGPEFRDRILATLTIAPDPPDATAYLFRYEERKNRLYPLPCTAAGEIREIKIPSVDAIDRHAVPEERAAIRDASAFRLFWDRFNEVRFPLRLPPGSYLVLLRRDGFAEARVPVLLGVGAEEKLDVPLLRPQEIPEGFVPVPGGPSVLGGDPMIQEFYSITARPSQRKRIEGFLIGRFDVTCEQYLEFLSELDVDEAAKRLPDPYWKNARGRLVVSSAQRPDSPVSNIGAEDAEAYAKWYTLKRGKGTWAFRLPTEDEWERAACGADGRFYSWGNRFDPSFAETLEPSPDARSPAIVGLCPADESPFGVRDVVGVVENWTATEEGADRVVRGGSFLLQRLKVRLAQRDLRDPKLRGYSVGFRLAASWPERR